VYALPRSPFLYDSVLTRAWPFVTLTPNCFALAMISMRFRADTEWEILRAGQSIGLRRLGWKTYSAAKVWLCMRRRSTSRAVWR
jgi:hypothetical protein